VVSRITSVIDPEVEREPVGREDGMAHLLAALGRRDQVGELRLVEDAHDVAVEPRLHEAGARCVR
jgi:hypothetical protein